MHAGHDQELPEGCDDCYCDEAAHVAESDQTGGNILADVGAGGSQGAEGKGQHDQQGQEGDEDGGKGVGNDLLKELLDAAHGPDGEDDGDDRLGIVAESGRNSEDSEAGHFQVRRHGHEVGGEQDAAHEHAQDGGGADPGGSGVAYIDGQEVEARVVYEVKEFVDIAFRSEDAQKIGTQHRKDGLEYGRSDQYGDQRGERACHVVEDVHDHPAGSQLFSGSTACVLRGSGGGEAADGQDFLIDLGNVLTDDDLELAAGADHAQDAAHLFDFLVTWNGIIL